MERIVVAIDGSEASQEALGRAVDLARQSHAALTGVFVMDGGWPDYIGNDWQSSKGARQGFLDYIRAEQERQAAAAHRQFESAAQGVTRAAFAVESGDPTEIILRLAEAPSTDLLILSRRVFQVSGRPSLKRLGAQLARKAKRPFMLLP